MAVQPELRKREQIAGVLERVCQELELSETQYEDAREKYETIGSWLADSENMFLRRSKIYVQGSIGLGTSIRPANQNEHDVDLVCHVPHLSPNIPPQDLKKLVGDRLKENQRYSPEEKGRCWRIKYANQFHLDITPSIKNPSCLNGGELVPDKPLMEWKPSNPKGYQEWFEAHAELQPTFTFEKAMNAAFSETRAEVESFPFQEAVKGYLKRSVQLCKHHRDRYFRDNPDAAPISIILTTLAAKSYKHCVQNKRYNTDLDILLDVVRYMPFFIEHRGTPSGKAYYIWNDTTHGENFAEKWNSNAKLPDAFFRWHDAALKQLEDLPLLEGYDSLHKSLSSCFSEVVVNRACSSMTTSMKNARAAGVLSVAPKVGLILTAGSGSVKVPEHTFYGDRQV